MDSSHSHSCKREEEKIKCYESGKEKKRNNLSFFRTSILSDSGVLHDESKINHPEENYADNSSCHIELVSDASHFVNEHKANVMEAVREMLIITLQANHILNQVDLDKNEKPDNISLKISHIILNAFEEDEDGNSTDERQVMDKKIEEFQSRPQNHCMSILFISEQLTKDEPVTVAYAGGVCKCGEHENPPKNVAVINTKSSSNSNETLQMLSWRMTEVIGQLMGSLEEDCEYWSNNSSEKDLSSSLSECRRENMKRTLTVQGSCLNKDEKDTNSTTKETEKKTEKKEKHCGDGFVDHGEECDCGKDCKKKFSCCNPPGEAKECTFNKTRGHRCDWSDSCCTMTCNLTPKSWNQYCGKGDPKCGPPNAVCDGSSHKCSVSHYDVKAYNGRRCNLDSRRQIGSGTCKDGFCNSTVCKDNGLQDCICHHRSRHECKVCCMKDGDGGKCQPVERFGLKSDESRYFLRDFGTPCKRKFNYHCNEINRSLLNSLLGIKIKMSSTRQVECVKIVTLTSERRGRCSLRRLRLFVKKNEAIFHYSAFFRSKMATVAFVLWNFYWKIFSYELF
ncbi:disintegrin domain-containing protein [Trichonephila inaurata madagascariensis]|uniref:Disintegrin domain-containing protein n=1 Tax=Trichonephila inaurata madagascariensis TaxID=2747483 RepID=A0A8X6XZG6_9ARAC|nr:disintegrin domain-containing protein [Trichonephila inaurata madagascariensis]